MEHDFEDIEVKENALSLLEEALRRKRKRCMIGTGAMTDPYIPLEMELQNVRKALSLICDYGFGIAIQTKSDRIMRDIDLLKKINDKTKAVVQMTLTTYDDSLCRKIEPGVCVTSRRVSVLKEMHAAGIPTVVWLSPILRGCLRRSRRERHNLLRNGTDAPGRKQGILLRMSGPPVPGTKGTIHIRIRPEI